MMNFDDTRVLLEAITQDHTPGSLLTETFSRKNGPILLPSLTSNTAKRTCHGSVCCSWEQRRRADP